MGAVFSRSKSNCKKGKASIISNRQQQQQKQQHQSKSSSAKFSSASPMSSPSSVKTRDTSSVLSSPCSASPPNTRNPKSCCDENQSDPSKLMETKIDGLNGSVALLSSPSNRSTKPEVQVLPPRRIVRTTVNGTRAKKIKTVSRINGNRMSAKKSSSRASSSTSMMMPVLAAHQARGAGRSKSSTNANNKNGATAAATLSPRPKGSDVQMNKEKVNIKAPSQSREFRANSRVKPSDHRVFYTRTKRATKSFKVTMIDEAFKIFVVDLLCGNPQDLEVVDAIKDETEAHIARVEASGNISASWRKLYTYTKMDLPCSEVTSIGPIMTQIMDDIKAVCGEIFQNPEGCQKLRPRSWKEPHLLKYVNTKDHKHTGIEMHYDGCDITWSLMLSDYATSNDVPNNPNEENINQQLAYRGGGTYMRCLQQTVLLKKGQILVHPGELYHKGVPITQGERLLGVCFMDGFNPGIYDPSVNCQTEVEQTLLEQNVIYS